MRKLLVLLVLSGCGVPTGAQRVRPIDDCTIVNGDASMAEGCSATLDSLAMESSDDIRDCLAGAAVQFASAESIEHECGFSGGGVLYGCYNGPTEGVHARYVVVLLDGMKESTRVWSLDHELRHRAAECETGDPDGAHASDWFAFEY